MTRSFFAVLVIAFVIWILAAIVAVRAGAAVTVTTTADGDPVAPAPSGPTAPSTVPAQLPRPVAELELATVKRQLARKTRQLAVARKQLHHRWRPTVEYAIRLASSATGVPAGEMYAVAKCESGLSPFASNGRYLGLFQLGWAPFGFSPFDPIANALSAAMTVQRDGGWRQWECKP